MKRRLLFASLVLALMVARPALATAQTINDGSSTNKLARLANSEETTFGSTTVLQSAPAGTYLVAEQIDGGFLPPFPSLRTVWYGTNARATGGVYRVSAEFRPAAKDAACQGGVMAWLDTATSNGLAFKVVPAAAGEFLPASFQVARVDFTATTSEANENVNNLFNLDGTPATADLTSAWSALDTNYLTTTFARFELAFAAPSTNDLTALSNATARVTARVYQLNPTNNQPRQLGRTVELLTDLPAPPAADHRMGYFGVWSSFFQGAVIGDYRGLEAEGAVEVQTNTPPTVRLIAPTNDASFEEPATIALAAEAADEDGSVARVEFYAGTNLIATAAASPFTNTWTGAAVGDYTLQAVATDNLGLSVTSAPVRISVVPFSGTPPTLTITQVGNTLEISWTSPGYQLQYKTDLIETNWVNVPNTTGVTSVTLPLDSGARYFRLVRSDVPGAPELTIAQVGNALEISWTSAGYQLQYKTDLNQTNWVDVPNTTGVTKVTVPLETGARYFRLVSASGPSAPALTLQASGTTVTVSWPAGTTGYRLQAKALLSDLLWTELATTGNQYVETMPGPTRFYRLIKP